MLLLKKYIFSKNISELWRVNDKWHFLLSRRNLHTWTFNNSKKYNNLVLWRILFTYRQCGFQKVQLVGWHGRKLPNFHQNTTTRLSAPQTRRARFILLSAGDRMKFQLCHSYYPLFVDRQCSKMSKKSSETQQNQYPTQIVLPWFLTVKL